MTMHVSVGRRRIPLPHGYCEPEDVRAAVARRNPPFVVVSALGERMFSTRRPVFLTCCDDAVRVPCEDDGDLGFACKLVAADHNREYVSIMSEETRACLAETERMERDAAEFMAAPPDDDDSSAGEEDDMTIEEWGQIGYNWFGRQDFVYM